MAEKCSCIFGMATIPGGQMLTEATGMYLRVPRNLHGKGLKSVTFIQMLNRPEGK